MKLYRIIKKTLFLPRVTSPRNKIKRNSRNHWHLRIIRGSRKNDFEKWFGWFGWKLLPPKGDYAIWRRKPSACCVQKRDLNYLFIVSPRSAMVLTTVLPDTLTLICLPVDRGCRALQKLFTSWYSSPVAVVIHSFPNFTRASLTNRLSAKLPRSRVCTHVTTVCASTCVMCLFGWRRYTWTFPFPPPSSLQRNFRLNLHTAHKYATSRENTYSK